MSGRRLIIIVRHLPRTSAVARALGEDWDRRDSMLDDVRRGVWALVNREDQPMHPDRPLAKQKAAEAAARALRRQSKQEAHRERRAAREARIRDDQQGGDP